MIIETPDEREQRLLRDTSLASEIIINYEGNNVCHESYGDVLYDNGASLIITYIDAKSRKIITAALPAGTVVTVITKQPQIK